MQLSRSLAARGHTVLHAYCGSFTVGHGALERRPADPPTFDLRPVYMSSDWQRYSWRQRISQEVVYGGRFDDVLAEFAPDVVLSSNVPLFAMMRTGAWCRRHRVPYVFWLQDIYSKAMALYAGRRIRAVGGLVGGRFVAMERWLLRGASGVVAITPDFLPDLVAWGVDPAITTVIPNWAPIEELPVAERDNEWAREAGVAGARLAIYSGTLGLKHDPSLLLAAADRLAEASDAKVVVVSEGKGADWLRAQLELRPRPNVVLLPYQPWAHMPMVLGSATVLLVLLQAEAGRYSVPSKLLTYLCSGRAIVAAVPAENLAARVLGESGAGTVVRPHDAESFASAVHALLTDDEAARVAGSAGRAYATNTFDIGRITDQFERVLKSAS